MEKYIRIAHFINNMCEKTNDLLALGLRLQHTNTLLYHLCVHENDGFVDADIHSVEDLKKQYGSDSVEEYENYVLVKTEEG